MPPVELSHYEFVRVSGPDAKQFLQGQLSCNVDELTPQHSLNAALCNLKGRVIADMRLLQAGDDCLLQTSAGMAARIIETLSRYAVFSKVTLAAEQAPRAPLGLIDENLQQLQELVGTTPQEFNAVCQDGDLCLIRVPGCSLRLEIWSLSEAGASRVDALFPPGDRSPASAWAREDLRAGIVHVDPGMSERYTPQLLNYDISGVINFNKGCYTGQEVVARMYYRGKPKQRMYLLNSPAPVEDGSELIQCLDGDRSGAEILAFNNGGAEGNFLLAVLDTAMVAGGASFTLGSAPESGLQLLELPYQQHGDGTG